MRVASLLLSLYRWPLIGPFARQLLIVLGGADIPRSVVWGQNLRMMHRGMGTVVHPKTSFGDNCTLYQGVTIGRRSLIDETPAFAGIKIGDRVTIGANAVLLAPEEGLTIADDTIVAAGTILNGSTGPHETWAGNPGKMVRDRSAEHHSP